MNIWSLLKNANIDLMATYPISHECVPFGTRFYVCHQWGDNFDKFRDYVTKEFGWTIKEV